MKKHVRIMNWATNIRWAIREFSRLWFSKNTPERTGPYLLPLLIVLSSGTVVQHAIWNCHPVLCGFFIDIKSFQSHYGPGVDSASNRNEYQEYLLGGKGGRCVRLATYHHPVPLSRNMGDLTSWNPLGLSRPVMGPLYLFALCCTQFVVTQSK